MKITIFRLIVCINITISVISCMGYQEVEPDFPMPTISSPSATQLYGNTFHLSAGIKSKNGLSGITKCGFYFSTEASMSMGRLKIYDGVLSKGEVGLDITVDTYGVTYYYKAFATNGISEVCSDIASFISPEKEYIDLSSSGTANCYMVPERGSYKFKATVKGNSTESVGAPVEAEVLWESFGTDVSPNFGDIVSGVSYSDGYICFMSGKDGNAVIAVKDASGTILWSWHIWVCEGYDANKTAQVYNNNAGTMMDRNLGATSATPGSVGTLGLFYQWGRKDPFLGSYTIDGPSGGYECRTVASSTISWPSAVDSNSSFGTIDYTVCHPTTYIKQNGINGDWLYTGTQEHEKSRWQKSKALYDPCPPGWHVPEYDVWRIAMGRNSCTTTTDFDSSNHGIDFGKSDVTLGSGGIWYPAAGSLSSIISRCMFNVGYRGEYWSSTIDADEWTISFVLDVNGYANTRSTGNAAGKSIRCQKE